MTKNRIKTRHKKNEDLELPDYCGRVVYWWEKYYPKHSQKLDALCKERCKHKVRD